MKKVKILYFFAILMFFSIIPISIYATDDSLGIYDIVNDMGTVNQISTEDQKVSHIINSVIKLIQITGSGVAVITVTFLGIKYMIASYAEKADIKKHAVPIVIGCVLLFAAVNIAGIIASFGNGLILEVK